MMMHDQSNLGLNFCEDPPMTFSIKNSLFFDIFHYNSETAATILIKLYMKNHWGSGMLHDQSSFWLKCAEGPPMSFSTQNSLNFNIFHYNLEMAPSIWTKFEMKNHWGSGMMHGQSSFWLKCSEGPPPWVFRPKIRWFSTFSTRIWKRLQQFWSNLTWRTIGGLAWCMYPSSF